MGWLDNETGAEHAARIKGTNQAIAEEDARRDTLEAGFQFVLTHDAELLQRLEDA